VRQVDANPRYCQQNNSCRDSLPLSSLSLAVVQSWDPLVEASKLGQDTRCAVWGMEDHRNDDRKLLVELIVCIDPDQADLLRTNESRSSAGGWVDRSSVFVGANVSLLYLG